MKKIGALIAHGYATDEFDKDLNITMGAIYDDISSKVIEMQYSTNYCQDEPCGIHYSALIIYEYEEGENEQPV
jgi:hypothetical protein